MIRRSPSRVPWPVLALLAGALLAQSLLRAAAKAPDPRLPVLAHPPSQPALLAAAAGDPGALARGLMLWLQALDHRGGASFALRRLDYGALAEWLDRIQSLDPRSAYPLHSAIGVYANAGSPEKARAMLDFVHAKFLEDPERRWRWLAVAALHARHRLADQPLALKYALALTEHASGPGVAAWTRDLSLLILRDRGEHRAAAALARRLLASGRVRAPHEVRYLEREFLRAPRATGARRQRGGPA